MMNLNEDIERYEFAIKSHCVPQNEKVQCGNSGRFVVWKMQEMGKEIFNLRTG